MSKPIIFFSHSSADKDVLYKLKELFVEKTGGTIDVFLSSDGQSIPLGKNWVHRVEEALGEAKIMVVFMTPHSLRSSWIYFEAGFAYSKGIRVVPVGLLGADIATLAPPLSLLQGFNVNNKDGLDNLIALANDVFLHNHKMTFTEEEYQALMPAGRGKIRELSSVVNDIDIRISMWDDMIDTPLKNLEIVKSIISSKGYEFRVDQNYLDAFGLKIMADGEQPFSEISFSMDPSMIGDTLPLCVEVIRKIRGKGMQGVSIRFDFFDEIDCVLQSHKSSSLLFGTGVKLGSEKGYVYKKMNFIVLPGYSGNDPCLSLIVTPMEDDIDLSEVIEIINIMMEKGVLYEKSNG